MFSVDRSLQTHECRCNDAELSCVSVFRSGGWWLMERRVNAPFTRWWNPRMRWERARRRVSSISPVWSVCSKTVWFKLLIVASNMKCILLHPFQRYIDRGVRTYTWASVNGTDYRWANSAFPGIQSPLDTHMQAPNISPWSVVLLEKGDVLHEA